jgi:hypothetical protein
VVAGGGRAPPRRLLEVEGGVVDPGGEEHDAERLEAQHVDLGAEPIGEDDALVGGERGGAPADEGRQEPAEPDAGLAELGNDGRHLTTHLPKPLVSDMREIPLR